MEVILVAKDRPVSVLECLIIVKLIGREASQLSH